MEITEAHIEFAKRQLQKDQSIPAVAGRLMNRTPEEAEFSDLIAIANRAKMELQKEETENTSESTATPNSEPSPTEEQTSETENVPDGAVDEPSEKQAIPVGGSPDTDPQEDDGDDIPASDEISSATNERGASSWGK